MGRFIFKAVVVVLLLFGFLTFQGFRQTWVSWGASTTPVLVTLGDVQPGAVFEDRHVELDGYIPLLDQAWETNSKVYMPLAPLPETGEVPTEQFELDALARNARVVASMPADVDRVRQLLSEGTGLVMGPVSTTCSTEIRTALKRELGQNAESLIVVEFGKKPSLLMGLGMILGGILGFVGSGFFALKQFAD